MADLASLVLAVDSTQVKTGTAALDGLTAAGARAEIAAGGLGAGVKGAGVQAAAMAAAAQSSARAAMDQAAGFSASTAAARINTIAMRETLVVARELSRGNFTRIPGSLTLLASNLGSGGLGGFAQALGLIKKVQDAELAEAASASAAATAAVQGAAERAAANVMAADTEVALAEAQVRVTAGTTAATAAQARLAAAHAAVAEAAVEAEIAENALASAMLRSSQAAEASAAATTVAIGTTGSVLIAVAVAATGAVLGFEALKESIADTGVLQNYAASLGLSAEKLDELKKKTDDFALTTGDVWKGVKKTIADAFEQSEAWNNFKHGNESAFKAALDFAINFASEADGYVGASYDEAVHIWKGFGPAIGDAFASAVNAAISGINELLRASTDALNSFVSGSNAIINRMPGPLRSALGIGNIPTVSAPQIAAVSAHPLGQSGSGTFSFAADAARIAAQSRAQIDKGVDTIWNNIVDSAEERIRKDAGKIPAAKGGGAAKSAKDAADATDDWLKNLDDLLSKQVDLSDLLKTQPPVIMTAAQAEAELRGEIASVDAILKQVDDTLKQRQETLMHFADEFGGAIADAVTGAKSLQQAFSDLARSVISELIQMTIKMLLFKALTSAFPGFFGPTGSGGGILGSANGNVFSGGNVIPFANGGVVTGPTLFPMSGNRTGLMGEKDPEAIIPLARDSQGRLGVRAANSNQLEITIGFGPAPDFAPYVQQVAGASAQLAVKVATDYTNGVVKASRRPKLMGQ